MMSDQSYAVRPELLRIPPYNAGLSIEEARRRYGLSQIVKLGSNENPIGPTPKLAELSELNAFSRLYPDPQGRELRSKLAEYHGISADRIVLGNGSEDLISFLCRAVVRPGDKVVTLFPSFPLHEDYTVLMGGEVDRICVTNALEIDVPALLAAVKRAPRLAMFSNPMNPVGAWLDQQGFRSVCAVLSERTLLVVDEAYAEYAAGDDFPDSLAILGEQTGKSWLILRTFSKAFGMAGLRIGYAVASDEKLAAFLDRARTPFNTNAIAQRAAGIALDDVEHLQSCVRLAISERSRVSAALRSLGVQAARSKGNFLFFNVSQEAVRFSEKLLRDGVIVKPWTQQPFDTYLRVSIGLPTENDLFLASLARCLSLSGDGVSAIAGQRSNLVSDKTNNPKR